MTIKVATEAQLCPSARSRKMCSDLGANCTKEAGVKTFPEGDLPVAGRVWAKIRLTGCPLWLASKIEYT